MIDDRTSMFDEPVYKLLCSCKDILILWNIFCDIQCTVCADFMMNTRMEEVAVCRELSQGLSNDSTFLCRIITGDESWIYDCDPETK